MFFYRIQFYPLYRVGRVVNLSLKTYSLSHSIYAVLVTKAPGGKKSVVNFSLFPHVSFSLEWKALMLLSENSVLAGSNDRTRTKLTSVVVVVSQRSETKRARVFL